MYAPACHKLSAQQLPWFTRYGDSQAENPSKKAFFRDIAKHNSATTADVVSIFCPKVDHSVANIDAKLQPQSCNISGDLGPSGLGGLN
jgi:hypothetical protein